MKIANVKIMAIGLLDEEVIFPGTGFSYENLSKMRSTKALWIQTNKLNFSSPFNGVAHFICHRGHLL